MRLSVEMLSVEKWLRDCSMLHSVSQLKRRFAASSLREQGIKRFRAGADLKERKGMPEEKVREFVSLLNSMMNAIATSPKV